MAFVSKIIRIGWTLAKWAVGMLLLIELVSFLIVSGTNLILYGHLREGSRAVYDPYTLFLQTPAVRHTTNNAKGAGVRKVWMFGGSTMRAATPDDALTIPSLVAGVLNGAEPNVAITNYGTNSFNSLLESKYLEKALIDAGRRTPDIVVFYDGANDVKYFLEHRSADAHHGYRRVKALIESYYQSWFGLFKSLNAAVQASFTRELYGRISQVALAVDPDSPLLQQMVDKAAARYDFVERLSAAFGARFVLIWQPMAWTESCAVDPAVAELEANAFIHADRLATMRANFATAYNALRERLAGKDYFVDFGQMLCGRDRAMYQPDGVHLTDDGRKAVAARMAGVLSGLPASGTR